MTVLCDAWGQDDEKGQLMEDGWSGEDDVRSCSSECAILQDAWAPKEESYKKKDVVGDVRYQTPWLYK